MSVKHLKPKDGLKVYDPEAHAHLPEDGRRVTVNSYWLRRLKDGDVIEVASNQESSED